MLKTIIITSLFLFSAQNASAFGLDDVNNAANSANAATDSAQKTTDTVDSIKEKSATDMAKTVASDSGKAGVEGAVKGASTGSVVDSGTQGAIEGAKSSLNKL